MWKVTWRNLFARKVRLLLSGFAIVLGVAFVAGSFILTDTIRDAFTGIIKGSTADVEVAPRGSGNFTSGPDSRTIGADVVANAPTVPRVAGIQATTPADHSYAYVGPDLQDIFGIDPATFTRGSSLRDSYFIGSSAAQALSSLRSTHDGVLVSKETIADYSLRTGDLLRLRVLDHRTGKFRIVPFHVVGIVQEFPAAPRDSFMVTNLRYLHAVTHDRGPNVTFVKTNDPAGVAQRLTDTAHVPVRNIQQQAAQTVSSITTVDLRGISRIEEIFALVLAAGAMALFVSVGLAERRHELATMAAVGASLREIAAFLWTEAALVLAGSLAFAAVLGLLIAKMLVAMLQHVFDPPPDHLAIPWPFLGGLTGAALAGTLVAAALAFHTIRRLPLGVVLREE